MADFYFENISATNEKWQFLFEPNLISATTEKWQIFILKTSSLQLLRNGIFILKTSFLQLLRNGRFLFENPISATTE